MTTPSLPAAESRSSNSMGYDEHKRLSRDTPVRCAVVTVSDTRSEDNDSSGKLMQEKLREAGHEVVAYRLIRDDPHIIVTLLDELCEKVEVVLFNGGTGISRRDTTFEALSAHLDRQMPGFGELFRMMSYEEIGAGAMLSRATAGLRGDTLVFSTPGSTGAVRLAMDRLIIPELQHLAWEVVRQK